MPPSADELFMECGGLGRFQVRMLIILSILIFPSAFIAYMPMFTLTIPKHRCAVDGYINDTFAVQSSYHLMEINTSIPWETNDGGHNFSSCRKYDSPQLKYNGTRKTVECSRYVYDKSVFDNSFIEKFDMVCNMKYMRSTANLFLMAGKILSGILQGVISDVFGRRTSVLFWIVVIIITSITSAFPINIPALCISRFVCGLSSTSIYLSSFVTALEFLCPQHRRLFMIIWSVVWVFGGLILTGVAYFIRDPEQLILTVSVPLILLLSYYWLVPESPRWLLSKGHIEKARKILEEIAKTNGKAFPLELFEELGAQMLIEKKSRTKAVEDGGDVKVKSTENKESLLTLLRHKKMAFQFVVLLCNWIANSLMYYALMFNVSNLSGSIHLNVLLLNCVDLFANISAYVVIDRFGRKWSYVGFMLVAALGCLLCMIPAFLPGADSSVMVNGFALLGRAGISTSFAVIYLYSAELVPTSIRSTCVGAFNVSSKLGSLFSPLVADLGLLVGGAFKDVLPMMVCGAVALVALLLSLTLPETVGRDLPNCVADAVERSKISDKKKSNSYSLRPL